MKKVVLNKSEHLPSPPPAGQPPCGAAVSRAAGLGAAHLVPHAGAPPCQAAGGRSGRGGGYARGWCTAMPGCRWLGDKSGGGRGSGEGRMHRGLFARAYRSSMPPLPHLAACGGSACLRDHSPFSPPPPARLQGEARRLVEEQAEAALASEDIVEMRHELVEAMGKYDKASEENSMLRYGWEGRGDHDGGLGAEVVRGRWWIGCSSQRCNRHLELTLSCEVCRLSPPPPPPLVIIL